MEVILGVVGFSLAIAVVIFILFGLFHFCEEFPLIGIPFTILLVAVIITFVKNEMQAEYTERSVLKYSYVFKQLKEEPEFYPGAKCRIKINIDENEQYSDSEINNTKEASSEYNNIFYIAQDCKQFREEIKQNSFNLNQKIEAIKIDKISKEEKSGK